MQCMSHGYPAAWASLGYYTDHFIRNMLLNTSLVSGEGQKELEAKCHISPMGHI